MLKVVLFLQVVLIVLFLGAGYFIYVEVGAISSALEEAMGVIADIQALLPKLDARLMLYLHYKGSLMMHSRPSTTCRCFLVVFLNYYNKQIQIHNYEYQILHD